MASAAYFLTCILFDAIRNREDCEVSKNEAKGRMEQHCNGKMRRSYGKAAGSEPDKLGSNCEIARITTKNIKIQEEARYKQTK